MIYHHFSLILIYTVIYHLLLNLYLILIIYSHKFFIIIYSGSILNIMLYYVRIKYLHEKYLDIMEIKNYSL
jgi:hypothetical protein